MLFRSAALHTGIANLRVFLQLFVRISHLRGDKPDKSSFHEYPFPSQNSVPVPPHSLRIRSFFLSIIAWHPKNVKAKFQNTPMKNPGTFPLIFKTVFSSFVFPSFLYSALFLSVFVHKIYWISHGRICIMRKQSFSCLGRNHRKRGLLCFFTGFFFLLFTVSSAGAVKRFSVHWPPAVT